MAYFLIADKRVKTLRIPAYLIFHAILLFVD